MLCSRVIRTCTCTLLLVSGVGSLPTSCTWLYIPLHLVRRRYDTMMMYWSVRIYPNYCVEYRQIVKLLCWDKQFIETQYVWPFNTYCITDQSPLHTTSHAVNPNYIAWLCECPVELLHWLGQCVLHADPIDASEGTECTTVRRSGPRVVINQPVFHVIGGQCNIILEW